MTPYNSRIGCFAGCFPHSQNQPYNSPSQIYIAGRVYFSKKKKTQNDRSNWNKKPDDEKIYRWTEFFTSWTITSEKYTRAHVQENKSIYLSIYLSVWKPFWKRVYIYIYIYNFTEVQVSRVIIVLLLQNCFVWCKDHTHQAILTTELLEFVKIAWWVWSLHHTKQFCSNKTMITRETWTSVKL